MDTYNPASTVQSGSGPGSSTSGTLSDTIIRLVFVDDTPSVKAAFEPWSGELLSFRDAIRECVDEWKVIMGHLKAQSYRPQHDIYRLKIVVCRRLPLSPSIASEHINRHGYDKDVSVYTFADSESLVSEVGKLIQDSAIGTTYPQESATESSLPTISDPSVSEDALLGILDRYSTMPTHEFSRLGSDGLPQTTIVGHAVQPR